jgi:cephalosporin hydroxylase
MDFSWPEEDRRELCDNFNRLYYGDFNALGEPPPFATLSWRGVRILKCPEDLFMYQEIIHRTKPDFIIETGVAFGGSTLYLADLCELAGRGRVIGVDVSLKNVAVATMRHKRVGLIEGDSGAEQTCGVVSDAIEEFHIGRASRIMVILDSDHSKEHVLKELALYEPFVTRGCYLIVEDTNINGRPVAPGWGDGPYEAVEEFLKTHPEFERAASCERLLVTFNPGGYLRRKK